VDRLQSAHEPPAISGSDITRMNYAYKRAAGAMLTTSFTTSIAFIATASSPVMPISAFGYFAASCVIMNYLLVMTVFPALLMVWHSTGSKNACCCDLPIPGWTTKDTRESVTNDSDAEADTKKSDDDGAVDTDDLRMIERMFVDYYAPFVDGPAKYGLVTVWMLYFIFSAYWAFQVNLANAVMHGSAATHCGNALG
jgi:fatty acid desaturase